MPHAPDPHAPREVPLVEASARDLVFVLFKHARALAVIAIAGVAATAFYLAVMRDPAYEVSAKLLVRIGSELANPSTMLDRPPTVVSYFEQNVRSEGDILRSTAVVERLVDYFHLDQPTVEQPPAGIFARIRFEIRRAVTGVKDLFNELLVFAGIRERVSQREFAIMMIQKGLRVDIEDDSNVLEAKLVLPLRQGSGLVMNKLIELYQDFRRETYRDDGTVRYFEERVGGSESRLHAAEQALAEFESKHRIVLIDKQKEVLLQRLAAIEAALAGAETDLGEAGAKLARYDRFRGSHAADFGQLGEFAQESFPDKIMVELAELQRDYERLRMSEFEGGIRLENNRKQFDALLGVLGSNLRSVEAERRAVRDDRKRELDGVRKQLESLHGEEATWNELKRQVRVAEGTYLFDRKKLDEASADAEITRRSLGDVVVIQPAMDAVIPAGTRKALLLAIAGIATLLAGLAWVVVAEFFDHRFYTAEALERHLGVPVLAVFPADAGATERRS